MKEPKTPTTTSSGNGTEEKTQRRWILSLFYAFAFTVFSFLADGTNLFGFATVVENQNERIYQRLTAGFYGSNPELAQESLAVMLYTDEAARLDKMQWPMNFGEFGDQVSGIAKARAQGIFIDIAFRSVAHDRDGFCEFIETIAGITGLPTPDFDNLGNCLEYAQELAGKVMLKDKLGEWLVVPGCPIKANPEDCKTEHVSAHGIPVIFGATLEYLNARWKYWKCNSDDKYKKKNKEDCEEAPKGFSDAILAWPATALIDHVALLAPISIGAEAGRSVHLSVDEAKHLSPAWRIARLVIDDARAQGPSELGSYRFLDGNPSSRKNLYVRWGGVVSPRQEDVMSPILFKSCATRDRWRKQLVVMAASQAFPSTTSEENLETPCPYHLTINMVDYYNGALMDPPLDSEGSCAKKSAHFDDRVLGCLLEGRFVLIGLAMRRFSDSTESPVHGRVAGVFAHAMAVDNLLEYGEDYFFTDPELPGGRPGWVWAMIAIQFVLTVFLAFLMLGWFDRIRARITDEPAKKWLTGVGVLLTLVTLLLLINSLLTGPANEPTNLLEYFLSALLVVSMIYTAVIYQHEPGSKDLKSPPEGKFRVWMDGWIPKRRAGLVEFMPHLVILLLAFAILTAIGIGWSLLFRHDPFNSLFTFLALVPLYLVGARDEIIGGLTKFLLNKDIAERLVG